MVPARFAKDLGTMFHINMDAVIPDPALSISEGGIAPLGEEREAMYISRHRRLPKRIRYHLTKPIKDIPEKSLNILLYGNEEGIETEDRVLKICSLIRRHRMKGSSIC